MYLNIAHNGFDLKGTVYTTSWVDRNSDFWRKKQNYDHTVQCNVVRVDLSFPINTFHKQIFKGTSIDIL